jgi:beta-xylosidase
MTQQEALDLIKKLLKAKDEDELVQLVSLHLSSVDGVFFSTADAAVRQLERDGKAGAANALRALTDRMLRMKTLI